MPSRKRPANSVPPPLRPAIHQRPLLSADQALALGRLFKVFSNDLRLRLLHALVREKELYVNELAEAVGMKPQAVSNQLQRLVDRGILSAKREGTNVCYSILDPCVPVLLERGVCLTQCCPEEK
jgi:DNA-binding transcriptional ArsR family regulator